MRRLTGMIGVQDVVGLDNVAAASIPSDRYRIVANRQMECLKLCQSGKVLIDYLCLIFDIALQTRIANVVPARD